MLPLPERYVDNQDLATLKTIEIIGRKKYEELLASGIIMVDHKIKVANQERQMKLNADLRTTIRILSNLIDPLEFLPADLLP